nr:uncharacterized protein LOC123755541 [Procambarus clarkii]
MPLSTQAAGNTYIYPKGLMKIFLVPYMVAALIYIKWHIRKQHRDAEYNIVTLRTEISVMEDMGYAVLDDFSENHSAVSHSDDRDTSSYANVETSPTLYLLDLGLLAARIALHAGCINPLYLLPYIRGSIYTSVDIEARAQAEAYAIWGVDVGDLHRKPRLPSRLCHHRGETVSPMWHHTMSEFFRHRATPSLVPDDYIADSCLVPRYTPPVTRHTLAHPLR